MEVALGLGLTPSSYGLFKKLRYHDVGPVPFFQKVLDARAVARAAPGARGRAVAAPVLRAALAAAPAGADAAGARRRDRGRRAASRPEYDALWERARGVLRDVRAPRRARTWTGSTCRCPHRRYDAAEARRDGALDGFAVSRHEDYRGLRLGWIVDVFADAGDHDGQGRAPRRACSTASARAGVARAQAFSMNAALAADLRRRGFSRGASPMQFCVQTARRVRRRARRPRALARRLRRQRHGPMSARPPAVLVGIDTEADDQWSAAGRREHGRAQRGAPARAAGPVRRVRRAADLPRHLGDGHAAGERGRPARPRPGRAAARSAPTSTRGARRPSGPRTSPRHTYPHNLPPDLLDRQLTRAHRRDRDRSWACGPRPTARAATASTGGTLPILERLGYTVDTSVDPLFNERRKGGMIVRGRAARALPPGLRRTCGGRAPRRSSRSRSRPPPLPRLPKALEARLRAPAGRSPGAARSKRLGLRAVWLRPSYTPLRGHARLRLAPRPRAGVPCFNIIFHSSELLPGGSPYTPGRGERRPLPRRPAARCSSTSTGRWARVGRTYAEFARGSGTRAA